MTIKRLVERLVTNWNVKTSYRIAKELGVVSSTVDGWRENVKGKPPVEEIGSKSLKKLIEMSNLSDSVIVAILKKEL